ncbi:MAG: hypothetical protein K2G45_01695 [Lachnospiraceae bacterium]|nr:hypothetical protein [Lachnospiraceae bacterium]
MKRKFKSDRKNNIKRKIALVVIVASVFTMTSCNKRKPVDMSETSGKQTEDSEYSISTSKEKISKRLGVEDNWIETLSTNNGRTVRIYAEVIVPDSANLKVYKAKKVNFDEELIENYINVGNFDALYYFDEASIPKEVWRGRIDNIKKQWENTKNNSGSYNDMVADDYPALIDEMEQKYNSALDDYKVAEAYDKQEYIGKKNNHIFSVDVYDNDFGWALYNLNYGWFSKGYPEGFPGYADDDNHFISLDLEAGVENGNKAGNKCSVSYDEVDEVVNKYVDDFGLTDFKISSVDALCWEKYTWDELKQIGESENWYDGYQVILKREIDGAEVACSGQPVGYNAFSFGDLSNTIEVELIKGAPYGNEESVRLVFNDSGILMFDHSSPFMITDVITENVELLDFKQIKERFKTVIVNSNVENAVGLKTLELKYLMIYDSDDSKVFSIIPAWFLSDGKKDHMSGDPCIVINAIDGSMITWEAD